MRGARPAPIFMPRSGVKTRDKRVAFSRSPEGDFPRAKRGEEAEGRRGADRKSRRDCALAQRLVAPGVQPGGAAAQAGLVSEICYTISCFLSCALFVSSTHEGRTKESTKGTHEENITMQESKGEAETHRNSIRRSNSKTTRAAQKNHHIVFMRILPNTTIFIYCD